jgi:hypothetical protein
MATHILVSEALHVHQALILEVVDGTRLVQVSLVEDSLHVLVVAEEADSLNNKNERISFSKIFPMNKRIPLFQQPGTLHEICTYLLELVELDGSALILVQLVEELGGEPGGLEQRLSLLHGRGDAGSAGDSPGLGKHGARREGTGGADEAKDEG